MWNMDEPGEVCSQGPAFESHVALKTNTEELRLKWKKRKENAQRTRRDPWLRMGVDKKEGEAEKKKEKDNYV